MSESAIRAKIKTLLEGVTDIGEVHDFVRHITEWEKIYKRGVKNQVINIWEISRESVDEELYTVQGQAATEPTRQQTHEYLIFGRFSLEDAEETEKTFNTIVENIRTTFRLPENILLSGNVIFPIEMDAPTIGHESFAGILVHTAELTLTAIERVGG